MVMVLGRPELQPEPPWRSGRYGEYSLRIFGMGIGDRGHAGKEEDKHDETEDENEERNGRDVEEEEESVLYGDSEDENVSHAP